MRTVRQLRAAGLRLRLHTTPAAESERKNIAEDTQFLQSKCFFMEYVSSCLHNTVLGPRNSLTQFHCFRLESNPDTNNKRIQFFMKTSICTVFSYLRTNNFEVSSNILSPKMLWAAFTFPSNLIFSFH